MSFSHSKRPELFVPGETPGPTDYEVKVSLVSDDRTKKFGFLESEKRFKSPPKDTTAPAAEQSDDSTSQTSSAGPQIPLPPTNSRASSRAPAAPSATAINEAMKYKKEAQKWQEQYERQIIAHQREMHLLEERLNRLDVSLKEATREKNSLASTAAAKEKELAEMTRRHNLLKSNLEKTEKQSVNLVEKATKTTILERKITDLEKTTAKTRSLVESKSTTLEKLQIERKELRDLSDALRTQVDQLIAEKEQRDLLLEAADAQRHELSQKLEEMEMGSRSSHEELEKWEAQVQALQDHVEQISSQKRDVEMRLDSVTRALDAARSEWDADKLKIETLESELNARTAELEEVLAEKTQFLAHRGELESQVQNLLTQVASATEFKSELEKEKESLEALLSDMRSRNGDVTEMLNRLEASVAEKAQHLSELEQLRATEQQEFEDVIESLKAALVARESESEQKVDAMSQEIIQLRQHLETGMHEIMERGAQLEAMTAEEEGLRSQIDSLKAELAATAEVSDTWQMHFQQADSLKSELQARVSTLEEELAYSTKQMETMQFQLNEAQSKVVNLEAEIIRLHSALDDAVEALNTANANHADALALNESQMEEMQAQLEEERQYRAGERDMAELRIASIQASSVDQLQQKAEAVAALEASVSGLKEQIKAKELELAALADSHRQEIGQLKFELTEQHDMVTEYRERAYDNEAAAEESQHEIEKLKEKLQARTTAHSNQMAEMEAAFKQIIGEFRQQIETLECEKAFVSDELETAKSSVKEHEARLGDSDALISLLKEKHAALEARIESLNAAVGDSKSAAEGLQKELEEYTELNAQLSSQNSEKAESIHSLQSDVGSLKSTLEDTQKANLELQVKLSETSSILSTTTAELNDKISSLEARLAEEQKSFSELKSQLELKTKEVVELMASHRAEVLAKDAEIQTANASMNQMQTEIDNLAGDYDRAQRKISELFEDVEKVASAHDMTKSQLEALQLELNAEKEAKHTLSQKFIELEAQLNAEMESGRVLHSEMQDLMAKKEAVETEMIRVTEELAVAAEAHASLKEQSESDLTREREVVVTERRRSQDLSASLDAQTAAVATLSEELDSLKKTLASESSNHAISIEKISFLQSELETQRLGMEASSKRVDELTKALEEEQAAHAFAMNLTTELSQTLANERRDTSQTIAILKSQLYDAESKLADAAATSKSLEENLAAEKAAHNSTRRDSDTKLAEFRKYHDDTKDNVALLVAALEQEKMVVQEKDDRLLHVGQELSQRTAELEGARMELDTLKSRTLDSIKVHEDERESHRSIVVELQSRSERLSKALEERDATVKDLETEVAAVKLRHANEVGRRDEEIRELKERLQNMEATCLKLKTDAEEVEQTKKELALAQRQVEAVVAKATEDKLELQDAIIVAERRQAEVEAHLKAQVDFLEKNHKAAFSQIQQLASANADLMGHQNAQQKIRHIAKMKEELIKMKEEHATLTRERDALRRKNMVMERDLEAYKAVVPVVSSTNAPADFKFAHATSTKPETEKSAPAALGPRKMSRVGRQVLAARASQEIDLTKPVVGKKMPVMDGSKTVTNSEDVENGDGKDATSNEVDNSSQAFFVQI
ncbi:hypothetical protein HDU79_002193 [Rhizoclosmatium sp. JEL0117]|nr:hypothetical protein HDU79_002193 [Rhizoclosmatium sp. JEL0117]